MTRPATTWDDSGAQRWSDRLGRLRDAVRQELVARQLDAVLPAGASVVDVGCGQGTQALRLARAGHRVVGLDLTPALLEQFAADVADEPDDVRSRVRLVEGSAETAAGLLGERFDAVLCHGVLPYAGDPLAMLRGLDAVAGTPGTLSLLVRNAAAMAMRPALLGDWAGARAALTAGPEGSPSYRNRLGLTATAHLPAQLDAQLEPMGWHRAEWFGVRVFSDALDTDAPATDVLEQIVEVESMAGAMDPYRGVAPLLHLVYRR